jgi:hypothetical protein
LLNQQDLKMKIIEAEELKYSQPLVQGIQRAEFR